MELKELNESKVCDILNEIIEYEMAGVVLSSRRRSKGASKTQHVFLKWPMRSCRAVGAQHPKILNSGPPLTP